MRKAFSIFITGLVMIWAVNLLLTSYVMAAPVEVMLYPASAQITEIQKLPLKAVDGKTSEAIFFIPGQSDPETLTTKIVSPANLKVLDQRWRQVNRPDEQTVTHLKKELADLKKEHRRLQSDNRSLETQIQFWQLQTKARMKTVAEAGNMSAAIGRNMKKTIQDKLSLEPIIDETAKKIKDIEEKLQQTTGKRETSWEVTIVFSGAAAKEATLAYGYAVTGCGWVLPLPFGGPAPEAPRSLYLGRGDLAEYRTGLATGQHPPGYPATAEDHRTAGAASLDHKTAGAIDLSQSEERPGRNVDGSGGSSGTDVAGGGSADPDQGKLFSCLGDWKTVSCRRAAPTAAGPGGGMAG